MSLFISRDTFRKALTDVWNYNERVRRHLFVNPDEACAYLHESNLLITNYLKKYANQKNEEMLRNDKSQSFVNPAYKDRMSPAKTGDIKPIGSYDRIKQNFSMPQRTDDDGFND